MTMGRSLSDVLDRCIARIHRGESVEACLRDYPELADDLRDELEAAVFFTQSFQFIPDADRKRDARLRMFEALERKQRRRFSLPLVPRGLFATGTRVAATAAVALVALVMSGTGTVLASQNSIPGDVLYSVKRTSEQVQLALSFSTSREADLRDQFIGRRVEELEQITTAGKERFVADLVDQIIVQSDRVHELAVMPVQGVVATLPDLEPPLQPAGQGPQNVHPIGTPVPTATPDPEQARDKEVSVAPVLRLSAELTRLEERVSQLEGYRLGEKGQAELDKLHKSFERIQGQLNTLLSKVDQVHNPDVAVVEPPDRDVPDAPAVTPTPTLQALDFSLGGRRTAVIKNVDFVQEKNKLVQVNVWSVLDDGSRLLIEIKRDGTKLLKDGKPASVGDLRIGQTVVLSVEATTGVVRAMSILDDGDDDSDGRKKSSRSLEISPPDAVNNASRGDSNRGGRSPVAGESKIESRFSDS